MSEFQIVMLLLWLVSVPVLFTVGMLAGKKREQLRIENEIKAALVDIMSTIEVEGEE